ncbi:hypothetical protein [Allonocardiopsis opalescens]|uniref:Integrase n=1 Tax=Allonocardiopsis opalescens TaxID=1144618 RepID=A0A2T0PXI0_9ACTN|nr:hypothetical protein [Allonocardiopsis opalescens]PRX96240.1 hypothetical protein CLV72_108247 [Allonocardiopsis opalescens]
MTTHPIHHETLAQSPFSGQYVHELLDLDMEPAGPRPRFDDHRWDLRGVRDTPIQFHPLYLVWDFSEITQPHWQLLVREFLVALRAPRHAVIAQLPWALRDQLSLSTCAQRRIKAVAWLRWLAEEGVGHLGELTQQHCDRWLHQRRADGLRSTSLLCDIVVVKDLARYTEMFTADRYPTGFMPWSGTTASQVAGFKRGGENTTPPITDAVLGPALRAGLYLVETVGPHAAALAEHLAARRSIPISDRRPRHDEYTELLADYIARGEPLPELDEHHVRERMAAGWNSDDPLLRVTFAELARDLRTRRFHAPELRRFREVTESAAAQVGVSPQWARDAALVCRADSGDRVPWSRPLTTAQVDDLTLIVFNAALFVTSTITGMRSGELMELNGESLLPPEEVTAGLMRFRLASTLIKGQQWGGVSDEWVVIEPAYRAVELAIRLAGAKTYLAAPRPRESVFGRFNLTERFRAFRRWVNSPNGARLGLEPIPDGDITARMTRRSLSLEMAHRPHGLWAAKVHLKQVSVSTTEGYAARPGGAQGRLHAEMKREEHTHKLELTKAAYRAYRDGRFPVGPGARGLIAAFEHVDDELAKLDATPATVVATDRHVELLLKKRAAALHIQPANYCWFTDPAKALCLKLAGTPTADQPLAGLCDAARCPQATFNAEHREIWAGAAKTTETFLGNPRIPVGEKQRLTAEHDRARQVIAAIDHATTREPQ